MYRKILIVGLFVSPSNKNIIYRTAADQLAEIIKTNGHRIIKTSTKVNKFLRAIDILFTILFRSFTYKIAILPYYGSENAFIIENISSKLLKLLRKKVVLVVHGGGLPQRINENPKKYLAILERVDEVVCPSAYLQHELMKYDINSIVIENVLKLSDYQFTEKKKFEPNILWMRAFSDIYHPIMAIKVFAEVLKKMPTAKMIMAGKDLGNLAEVKLLAQELKVDEHISFPGYVQTENKNRLANEVDVYICTNKIDNAPVTFIEMMALGIPIVSVNTGGIPFLVTDNFNALLVKFDDHIEMANRIINLVQNPVLANTLVQNGLNTSKKYDEKVVLTKWEMLMYKLK